MGTRNLTLVRLRKKLRVAQYCQWDGYPSGQGLVIAEFIQAIMNLEKFKQRLEETEFKSAEEIEALGEKVLSRDVGAKVLELIQSTDLKYLVNSEDFLDSPSCEWAYVLDLDDETLTIIDNGKEYEPIPFKDVTEDKILEYGD